MPRRSSPEAGRGRRRVIPGFACIIIDHMGRLARHEKDATLRARQDHCAGEISERAIVKLTLISECTSGRLSVPEHPTRGPQWLIDAFSPRRSFLGTDLSVMLESLQPALHGQAVTLFTQEMGYSQGSDREMDHWGEGLAECLPWPIK